MFSVAIPLRYWPNWTSMNPENVVPPIRSSLLSFFYNVKYPPSVVFTLVTLSGNHLVLSLFFKYSNKLHPVIKHVLLVYGTNSLFFYCTHMLLFRAMRAICGFSSFSEGGFNISQWWSVAVCYLIALVIEYWICLWFGSFKKGTRKDSLWRLF
ncbi:hypothetical protein BCR33DRAFT_469320 [Rhizoclosmatium globosum]|uniref:Acyltransferase 3 domain-containing protein n=1 Tax=Rhizoclosmatium globosum TaxID=329046 RepID=A0A1Y2BQM9_9FUNG|nr:hypothetical protein BCR33DRAFT_469320 [Rhizoclosmatium globosum]|eukprot:ORY37059.1 hypothetical protein BCR33DRAFT_469320 [Rhizoclosmatium globosum]